MKTVLLLIIPFFLYSQQQMHIATFKSQNLSGADLHELAYNWIIDSNAIPLSGITKNDNGEHVINVFSSLNFDGKVEYQLDISTNGDEIELKIFNINHNRIGMLRSRKFRYTGWNKFNKNDLARRLRIKLGNQVNSLSKDLQQYIDEKK